MTTFPTLQPLTITPPDVPSLSGIGLSDSINRGARIDRIIDRQRKLTPRSELEQRSVPRSSIAELNESDIDELRLRLLRSRRDDRSPIMRALDLIDLPRNAVANVISGIFADRVRREKIAQGDRAAFGLPRVMFSDLLREMGIRNRVARGVVGFIGDVALDPLTYAGGAGFGIRSGKVALRAAGKRELQRGIREAAKSGLEGVRDQAVRSLIESTGVLQRAARGTGQINAKAVESALSTRILGPASSGRVGRVIERVGATQQRGGGLLDKALGAADATMNARELQQINAAKQFVQKYGRGTGQGLRLGVPAGSVGTEILHVPFTDITVQVPAFTSGARGARTALAIARDTELGLGPRGVLSEVPQLGAAHQDIQTIRAALTDQAERFKELDGQSQSLRAVTQRPEGDVTHAAVGGVLYDAPSAAAEIERLMAVRLEQAQQTRKAVGSALQRIKQSLASIPDSTLEQRPSTVLALGELASEAESAKRAFDAQFELAQQSRALIGDAAPRADTLADDLERLLSQHDIASSDPVLGPILASGTAGPVVTADADTLRETLERVRPILDQIDEMAPDAGTAVANVSSDSASPTLRSLRARLIEETLPLRSGDDIESVGASLNKLAARADDRARATLAQLTETIVLDKGTASVLADTMRDATEAAADLAATYKGRIRQFMSPEQGELLDVARHVMGVEDDLTASSIFAPIGHVMRAAGVDERARSYRWLRGIDRANRRIFNHRTGYTIRQVGKIKSDLTRGAHVRAEIEALAMRNKIGAIGRSMGIPISHADDLEQLATIYAYQEARALAGLEPAQMATHVVRDGKLEPGPMIEALQRIEQSRALTEAGPELFAQLRQVAREAAERFRQIGIVEQDDNILSAMLAGYVPNVQTAEAERATRIGRRAPDAKPQRAATSGEGLSEQFQKPRTTWKYQFEHDGRWHEFLEMDKPLAALTKKELAEMAAKDPASAMHAQRVRESVRIYEKLAKENPARAPQAMATDVFELNQMYRLGRFAMITQGNPAVESYFETSLPLILGRRSAQHQRAVARKNLSAIVSQHAIPIDGEALRRIAQAVGSVIELPGGGTARIVDNAPDSLGSNNPILAFGGDTYRQLGKETLRQVDSPLAAALDLNKTNFILPEALADKIDQVAQITGGPQSGELMRAMEKATGWWKSVTLAHPSWLLANVVGDLTLAVSGGVPVRGLMNHYRDVLRIRALRNAPEKLRELTIRISGRELRGDEALKLLDDTAAFNDTRGMETILQAQMRGVAPTLPSRQHNLGGVFGSRFAQRAGISGQAFTQDWRAAMNAYAVAGNSAAGKATAGALSFGTLGTDRIYRTLLGPWMRLNSAVSDVTRGAALFALLDEGDDVATASQKMARALFDYSDFSRVEERVFRNLIPFYSWMRNNLVYQMQLLAERPSVAASVPKLKRAIEETVAGDARVPDPLRPGWMLDALAIQVGAEDPGRYALLLGNTLPQAEVFNVIRGVTGLEGALDVVQYFASGTNPVVSGVVQAGVGQEFFSGRTIGADATSGDISATEFLARQIRPVNELGIPGTSIAGRIPRALSQSPSQGAARAVLGGRVQDFSSDRLQSSLLYQLQDEERGIRRAINRAEREGRTGDSLTARVKLLQLYQRMIDAGLADEVPKWAAEQLGVIRRAS